VYTTKKRSKRKCSGSKDDLDLKKMFPGEAYGTEKSC